MSSFYSMGRVIHDVHLQVLEAEYAARLDDFPRNELKPEALSRKLLIKTYTTSSIDTADTLLKKAVPLIETQYSDCAKLVDVFIESRDSKQEVFSMSYVLEMLCDADDETYSRDDSFGSIRKGLEGYEFGSIIASNSATSVGVFKAQSTHFKGSLAIKKAKFGSLFEVNAAIREGVHQARAKHTNSCRLLDMALKKDGRRFDLYLIMEEMPKSLKEDIETREEAYSEEEIVRFLREVGSALLHAKQQNIAHCDIKPENVFIAHDKRFVLGDFGSSWEMQLRSVTVYVQGTFGYMAPEIKKDDRSIRRPFPADIFSLGMTTLCMGCLGFPRNQEVSIEEHILMQAIRNKVNKLPYSDQVKALILKMTDYNPHNRPLLQEVIESLDTSRKAVDPAALETVQAPSLSAAKQPSSIADTSSVLPYLDCFDFLSFQVKEMKQVKMYDAKLTAWRAVVNVIGEMKVDKCTTYLMLAAGLLFCCGNRRCTMQSAEWSHQEAYVLHVDAEQSGQVEALPLMKLPRRGSGLLYSQERIFVFGGHWTEISGESVEVFASPSWTLLPEMSCHRAAFTPCEYCFKAYLFDARNPTFIDVFDLATLSFLAPISVQLKHELHGTVCVVLGEELVILSSTYVARLNLRTQSNLQVAQHDEVNLYPSSSTVVAVEERVYWMNYQGLVMFGDV